MLGHFGTGRGSDASTERHETTKEGYRLVLLTFHRALVAANEKNSRIYVEGIILV